MWFTSLHPGYSFSFVVCFILVFWFLFLLLFLVWFGFVSFLGICSVPAFKNKWYWKHVMDGEADYVEFHNQVYGCSGVMPDK